MNSHHWLPRQGEPLSSAQWVSQHIIRALAFLPIYIAVVVTIILVIQVFHPLGLGAW